MKHLISILLFLFILAPIFSNNEVSNTLEESNKLLEQALIKIETLENEIEELTTSLISKEKLITKADKALEDNNKVLKMAWERIDKDQDEILKLRNMIGELIDAGVEITTYHWNIMFTSGYPLNTGLSVAYNLHFFPLLGIVVGFNYNWEINQPLMTLGIKINLK